METKEEIATLFLNKIRLR